MMIVAGAIAALVVPLWLPLAARTLGALALDVRHSYKGRDVGDTLERIAADYGRPQQIRVDNGR